MAALSSERKAFAKVVDPIVERFLKRKPHLVDGKKAVKALRTGEAVAKKVGTGLIPKLKKLFPEVVGLSKTEVARRAQSKGFARLFGKALEKMRAHPERLKYHSLLEELHAEVSVLRAKNMPRDLDPITGANRAIDPETFAALNDIGQVLYHSVAGAIDSYGDLTAETKVFNGILKALYPEKFVLEFQLDAQHLIEQRAFPLFKDMWGKLGWSSIKDLPATPLHTSFHIRTPKNLENFAQMLTPAQRKGFTEVAELAEKKDIKSLTDALEQAIPKDQLAKMKTPEEYVAKLIEFYTPSKIGKEKREIGVIGKDIVPVLKEIDKEIGKIRDLEKLAAASKAAKK